VAIGVGPCDRVDDLRFVEVLGPVDLGHEPDEVPVLHDLRLEADGAVGVPLRIAAVVQRHLHPKLIHAGS
jgi:hypothetical protein